MRISCWRLPREPILRSRSRGPRTGIWFTRRLLNPEAQSQPMPCSRGANPLPATVQFRWWCDGAGSGEEHRARSAAQTRKFRLESLDDPVPGGVRKHRDGTSEIRRSADSSRKSPAIRRGTGTCIRLPSEHTTRRSIDRRAVDNSEDIRIIAWEIPILKFGDLHQI